MTAPSIKEALTIRAQAFVDRKYVMRADARQKEMGLAYVEAERQDLAREIARFCSNEVDAALATLSQPTADRREIVARAICKSGRFETGQGTCAVLCMDQLGDVRKKGCGHCIRVHAKLADAILAALDGGAGA